MSTHASIGVRLPRQALGWLAVLAAVAAPRASWGSSVSPLVSTPYNETQPMWSPDGTQVAYVSDESGAPQLHIINADGTGEWQVTTDAKGVAGPTWSPDSKSLLYSQLAPAPTRHLFKVKLSATRDSVDAFWDLMTSTTGVTGQHFRYSPDGSTIVTGWSNQGSVTLRTLADRDGTATAADWQSIGLGAQSNHPTWSPDGSLIAYAHASSGTVPSQLRIIQPNGSGDTLVAPTASTGEHIWHLAWSQDGGAIAFSNWYDSPTHLGIVNADGTGLLTLDTDSVIAHQAYSCLADIWSADGQSILYSRNDGGVWNLYMIDSDGTDKELIVSSLGDDQSARFSPDGKLMCFQTNRNGSWDIYVGAVPDVTVVPLPAPVAMGGILLASGGIAGYLRKRRLARRDGEVVYD